VDRREVIGYSNLKGPLGQVILLEVRKEAAFVLAESDFPFRKKVENDREYLIWLMPSVQIKLCGSIGTM